jgi:hypothetical protein
MTIKAQRITISGGKPFQDVEIWPTTEQGPLTNLFESDQISFKNKDGTYTLPQPSVILIHINSHRRKIHPDFTVRAKRISISGDLIYSPVHIVRSECYEEAKIPIIFRHIPEPGKLPWDKQFTFVCEDGFFITTDYMVEFVEW